ncbi:MAG: hypothetical protein WAV78_25565, partial [Xanthobacteraceae bacterium]
MSGDDLALNAIAFSPRARPATLALNRSKSEAIFPIDLAAKLVSFGNAARLGRGVSVSGIHAGEIAPSIRQTRIQSPQHRP